VTPREYDYTMITKSMQLDDIWRKCVSAI
jgi:hypothetical protein